MAGILVYIPNGNPQDPRGQLERVGLGPLLDRSVDAIATHIRSGPDGGSGVLITFDAIGLAPTPREYNADTQHWQPAPPDGELAKDRFWLGYVKGAKPSAAELQRAEVFDGEPVTLSDGNGWLVPIAALLPKRLARDPNTGEELRTVSSEHREFDEWANALLDMFMSDGFQVMLANERRVQIPRGMRFAALALAKNYRLTIDVIDMLGLVGEIEAVKIAMVASGVTSVEKALAQKKSTKQPSLSAAAS